MFQTLFGPPPEPTLFEKFQKAVAKTRSSLAEQINDIFQGKKVIDEELLEELEMTLISADLGMRTTTEIIESVREKLDRKQLKDPEELKTHIARHMMDILEGSGVKETPPAEKPELVLIVGVNGTGKTTTIGKLAHRYQNEGKKVLLCAGDTFRAAAAEQLEVWGQRTKTEVIRQKAGADPSAVLYDAIQAGKARGVDIILADTAGRLHNKTNLMSELEKMKRTAERLIPGAPHRVLLVLDAITGQNGLEQAKKFTETAGVTGIVLTKLDGTAKGGIVIAIARELGTPIQYVGVGEKVEDLLPFDPKSFVLSIFETKDS